MGESTVEHGGGESGDQLQEVTGTPVSSRSEFYEAYKQQAKIFDGELKEYNKELNVTLLFAALFAVIVSAFLRIDENKRLLLAWNNEQAASAVTTIVFCSLTASLLVALLALFAKRTLKRYAILDFNATDLTGGPSRAPNAFHRSAPRIFGLLIEGLSLVLQATLLVVSCVLANHLWSQDQWTASIAVACAEILCIITITSAIVGPTLLGASDGAVAKNIKNPLLQALVSTRPNVKNFKERTLPKRQPSWPNSGEKLEVISNKDVPIIFEQQPIDWSGCVSDSLCITWMFDRPIDSDEAAVVLDFITQVVWHSGICEVPLVRVFEIFDKCFDYSKGTPTLIPRLRDRAYKAGRALVHLGIQRKCVGEEKADPLDGLRGTRGPYSLRSYDSDLDSILNIVDRLLGNPRPINWTEFKFSETHQRWLSHILLYRAWDHLCYASKLPEDVEAFIAHAFSIEGTHPAVVTDCLFMISLVAGIPLHADDLAVDDKSSENEALSQRIFSKLESTFTNQAIQEGPRCLDVLRLITPLQNAEIAKDCYSLFHVILSSSFETEELWAAARLAMYGAYKWDKFLPWVEEPDDIIKFLSHHFAIQAKGEDDVVTEPIENAFRAIAYSADEKTSKGLERFDSTEKLFVDGFRKTFEKDQPFQMYKAALFFLPKIQDRWFDDSLESFMSDETKGEFCENWGSAVDGIEHTMDVKKAVCWALFGMLNSEKWRSHIPKSKLKLIGYFADLPEDSKHFAACKANASVLPWLRSRAEEAGEKYAEETKLWKLWLAILWSDYTNLPEEVRKQVLDVTKGVISKAKHDVSFISRIMTSERKRYCVKLDGHEATSLEDEPDRLRARVEGLNESIEKFAEVVGQKAN